MESNTIWTIGHSTRRFEDLIAILNSFDIQLVADIRNYPGSRKYPHFNKESLETTFPDNDIGYIHVKELGGRKKAKIDSKNTGWKHPAFRGYADYMETSDFNEGIERLVNYGSKQKTAYMCSEAVWWRCHRSLISDYLKLQDWNVMHISGPGKAKKHSYTNVARIENGMLHYRGIT